VTMGSVFGVKLRFKAPRDDMMSQHKAKFVSSGDRWQ